MENIKARIDELANLMEEFHLEDARLSEQDWSIEFSHQPKSNSQPILSVDPAIQHPLTQTKPLPKKTKTELPKVAVQKGEPLESPITGIFYHSASPDSPPFVKEGDSIQEGQVIGLVEAMKVFNEITSSKSGIVSNYQVAHGQMVQPGDVLIFID